MTWEEYQNTDFYKESHPDWNHKPSDAELKEELMRSCLSDIDYHREELKKNQFIEVDGEEYDQIDDGEVYVTEEGKVLKVTYVCASTWNGRMNGLLGEGDYESCRMRKYEYDLANMRNEWQWACIEKVTYETDEELEEILDGYRELSYDSICDYDDYDDYDY